MKKVLFLLGCAALSLSGLAACGGGAAPPSTTPSSGGAPAAGGGAPAAPAATKPESTKVTWKKDGSKSCHTHAKTGDLATNVAGMSKQCMAANMKRVGTPTMGEGTPEKMVQQIPLPAAAGKCYRVVGIAEPTVTDFDIAVQDSAGKTIGEDVLDSNDAVVLEDGVFCFNAADTASINVAVANGSGKWAIEVWSD